MIKLIASRFSLEFGLADGWGLSGQRARHWGECTGAILGCCRDVSG